MSNRKIKVCIADDHQEIALGLIQMLNQENDIEVIGTVKSKEDLIVWLDDFLPHILLLDIRMPQAKHGLAACKYVRKKFPEVRIITYSAHESIYWIEEMRDQGSMGYLRKGSEANEIATAIREVAGGKTYFRQEISSKLKEFRAQNQGAKKITRREMDVLRLIVKGYTTHQISIELSVSDNTVETHRKNLFAKCQVKNAVELFRFANENGLIDN